MKLTVGYMYEAKVIGQSYSFTFFNVEQCSSTVIRFECRR